MSRGYLRGTEYDRNLDSGQRTQLLNNTISGNTDFGVEIGQPTSGPLFQGGFYEPEDTRIIRNSIGTNAQRTRALGNGRSGNNGAGIAFWRGKSLHLYLNTISGNHHGVMSDKSPFNEWIFLAGNFIGLGGVIPAENQDIFTLPEIVPIPNLGDGIHITDGKVYLSNEPTIDELGDLRISNHILNNAGAGVRRTGSNMSSDLVILQSVFFGITGLAIDIGDAAGFSSVRKMVLVK